MTLLTTPELVRETVKEPARAWTNLWKAVLPVMCGRCGSRSEGGEVYIDCCEAWPSYDMAETAALAALAQERAIWGDNANEYLGPVPEGARP
ncbi:MAG TPA: hypothetical protein VM915_15290 [Verrucomicrobiae bacterium]|jgi:hypothetical protein|nr:hypothetical protein [Verrucomicrobiae bacterium]